jgi:hypothetical protein
VGAVGALTVVVDELEPDVGEGSACAMGLEGRGSTAPKFKRGAEGNFRTSLLAHIGHATKPLSRCDW